LESVGGAIALADNELDRALEHQQNLLGASQALADEPNVACRVAAANLQADGLYLLSAVAGHSHSTQDTLDRLFALLAEHTADWPADARAWAGDRAAGLLVYELVRNGQYLSLLSRDEVEQLTREQTLRITAQAVMRNIDEDERFYLQAMRQLLDSCRQPYHERQATLIEIRRQLEEREQSARYPMVAGKLLLVDFELCHRSQAEDFARCQAWMLALGAALGEGNRRRTNQPPDRPAVSTDSHAAFGHG
jgi:hypothetical protein